MLNESKLILIDGYGFLFRAYYALPSLTAPDGTPIGAIHGFLNMLIKLVNRIEQDKDKDKNKSVIVVLDSGNREGTFRHTIYPQYKANRKETPDELKKQFLIMREALEALGIRYIESSKIEADDIIAAYTEYGLKIGHQVEIVSSDKDLLQLVNNNVLVYDPMKEQILDEKGVKNKMGVNPSQIIDYLAMVGDSADNIPGIPGIGPKTAVSLLEKYDSLKEIYNNLNDVKPTRVQNLLKNGEKSASVSLELIRLNNNVFNDYSIEEWRGINVNSAIIFFDKYNLSSLRNRIEQKHQNKTELGCIKVDCNDDLLHDIEKGGIVVIHIEGNDIIIATRSLYALLPINYYDINFPQFSAKVELDLKAKSTNIKLLAKLATDSMRFRRENVLKGFEHEKQFASEVELCKKSTEIDCEKRYGDMLFLSTILSSSSIKKVFTNYQSTIRTIRNEEVNAYEDLATIAYILGYRNYNLNYLMSKYLKQDNVAIGEIGDSVIKLYHKLYNEMYLNKNLEIYLSIDRPILELLAHMEKVGILVNKEYLNTLENDFAKVLKAIEDIIYSEAGEQFNLASPKQVSYVLFEKLNLSLVLKKSKMLKRGQGYSTSSSVLEFLASNGIEIAKNILQWRQIFKLRNTYVLGLLKNINNETNRIHCHFHSNTTSTARLSASNPNLQSIPIKTSEGEKIRKAFIAKKGHLLISLDYSQIEIRILAHIANVSVLQNAIIEGKDIHSLTAHQVFGIPLQKVDSTWRRRAKAINFGIIYGISSFGLANNLKISITDAERYIEGYFKTYPEIKDYMSCTIDYAKKHNYVLTLFNRRCYLNQYEINSSNKIKRQMAERAAINAPIQGTAADIIKIAMVNLPKEISQYLLLQIHDELIFEVPSSISHEVKEEVVAIMSNAAKLNVPLVVDAYIGDSLLKS